MLRDDSGKLVLESAMLYPLILMITLGAVLLGLGTGLRSVAFIQSDSAASRTAFTWDNSNRNPVTGAFFPGMYDDLYWRLTSDYPSAALAGKKVASGLATYSDQVEKEGSYRNDIWMRQVITSFRSRFVMPGLVKSMFGDFPVLDRSISVVTDPVEWVRNVDTIRVYWPLIKNSISSEQADQIVEEFRNRPGAKQGLPIFNTHDEARAYLQQLVRGRQSREQTEDVGKWRLIDARDSNNIAHQAYYGLKTLDADMEYQLLKDAELLSAGKVKGVTWHFFKRNRDQTIGLTDKLRKELEKRGIVIVIHE
jgi:hypothetical protein